MKTAAKENIPLQLHVEGESDETYPDLAVMADKAGLDRKKLVRHYAPASRSLLHFRHNSKRFGREWVN